MSERRAYQAAVVAVSLNTASDALSAAFGAALDVEDYDSDIVTAIRRAQAAVKEAHKIGPLDWHRPRPAMTDREY